MANARRSKRNDSEQVVRAVVSDLARSRSDAERLSGRCVQHLLAGRQIMIGLLPTQDPVLDARIREWLAVDPRVEP